MTSCKGLLLVAIFTGISGIVTSEKLPVVLWHGMGASSHTGGSSELKELLQDKLGVYVFSISTGGSDAQQVYSGFFGNLNEQVESVCTLIQAKEQLRGGYNAIGLSQVQQARAHTLNAGGLFLRAVVERCQHRGPSIRTLITLGSPHQGIINIPTCTGLPGQDLKWWDASYWPCRVMQKVLDWGAYVPWVRDHVVQAQYFRDPYDPDTYLASNPFLPDINNERDLKVAQYRENLGSLEKLVLFRFDGDFTVVPRDSAWFGAVNADELQAYNETDLYKEDFIGLRQLDEEGRVDFKSFSGFHMQFGFEDFENDIMWPYLSDKDASQHPEL